MRRVCTEPPLWHLGEGWISPSSVPGRSGSRSSAQRGFCLVLCSCGEAVSHSTGHVSLSQYVSCPELLDQHYNVDMAVTEHSLQHPITKSSARRIVHTGSEQNSHRDPTARHHCISLCRELEPYSAIIAAINDSKTSNVRQKPITFENATHYYLYNRLVDFLTSREIVNRQIQEIVQSCQPGEVVIRDALYRLGVAQIKTETEEEEERKQEGDRGY